MKISIVTVCYQAADVLERTIRSVLSQRNDSFEMEYLMIDGGSKDGTVDLIRKYSDRLGYWCSEPDHGIYDAMNKGIEHACGDWIGILNADDVYLDDTLCSVAKGIRENPHAEVIHGNLKYEGKRGPRILTPRLPIRKNTMMPVLHPTCFVKKSIYAKLGGFDAAYALSADYDFILRCIDNHVSFLHLDRTLAAMTSGGASDRKYKQGLTETRLIALRHGLPSVQCRIAYSLAVLKKDVRRWLAV